MLFRKKIDRYCTYCQFSGKVDEDSVICKFCGIVPCTHHCRRFRYDPLKRVPARRDTRALEKLDEKDFSL